MVLLRLLLVFMIFCVVGCSRTTLESVEQRYDRRPPAVPPSETVVTEEEVEAETDVQTEIVLQETDRITVTIKTTPCYGKCPVYEVKFTDNSYVTRRGYAHTDNIGSYEARIEGKVIEEIKQRIISAGLYQMEDMYPTRGEFLDDYGATVISIREGEKEKRIVHIYDAPPALREFEDYLLSVTKKLQWEKITEFAD